MDFTLVLTTPLEADDIVGLYLPPLAFRTFDIPHMRLVCFGGVVNVQGIDVSFG